jgi:hypothetical protein
MLSVRRISFTGLHVLCSLAGLALAACGGAADDPNGADDLAANTGSAAEGLSVHDRTPPLPDPSLAVPDGNRLAFHYDAAGVQIYACTANASGAYSWVFQAPEATLYGKHGRVVGKHYVGPTWEGNDGSKVVGAKVAGFTADPTAIPELLLKAVSNEGKGTFAKVTFIQRLDTTGGLAPTTGCDADHPTATARVDYTATYYFYEAEHKDCP